MSDERDPAVHALSMCCGKQKCPVFTVKNDGVSITDAALLGENSIDLTPEQATTLRAWLESQGF